MQFLQTGATLCRRGNSRRSGADRQECLPQVLAERGAAASLVRRWLLSQQLGTELATQYHRQQQLRQYCMLDAPVYMFCGESHLNKISQSNLGTGCVAIPGGRASHSRRTQSFNRICQVAPTCTFTEYTIAETNPTYYPQTAAADRKEKWSRTGYLSLLVATRFRQFCTADATFSQYVKFRHFIFRQKINLYRAASGTPSNAWFFTPSRSTTPNGILIESTIFPQYPFVTNKPTD